MALREGGGGLLERERGWGGGGGQGGLFWCKLTPHLWTVFPLGRHPVEGCGVLAGGPGILTGPKTTHNIRAYRENRLETSMSVGITLRWPGEKPVWSAGKLDTKWRMEFDCIPFEIKEVFKDVST